MAVVMPGLPISLPLAPHAKSYTLEKPGHIELLQVGLPIFFSSLLCFSRPEVVLESNSGHC